MTTTTPQDPDATQPEANAEDLRQQVQDQREDQQDQQDQDGDAAAEQPQQ